MNDNGPDFDAQFREPPGPKLEYAYMGGTAVSCGTHPTLPKQHRWGPWREIDFRPRGGSLGWERTCKVCALVSDIEWTKPRGVAKRPQRISVGGNSHDGDTNRA